VSRVALLEKLNTFFILTLPSFLGYFSVFLVWFFVFTRYINFTIQSVIVQCATLLART